MMLMQNKWGKLLQTSLGEEQHAKWWRRFEDRVAGIACHLPPDSRIESIAVSQPLGKNADPAAEVEEDFEREIEEVIQDLILRGDFPQLPSRLREELIEQAKQARKPPPS